MVYLDHIKKDLQRLPRSGLVLQPELSGEKETAGYRLHLQQAAPTTVDFSLALNDNNYESKHSLL